MNTECADFLSKNGFARYFRNFSDAKVETIDCLRALSQEKEILSSIIPDAAPQALFITKLNDYVKRKQQCNTISDSVDVIESSQPPVIVVSVPHANDLDGGQPDFNSSDTDFDESEKENNLDTPAIKKRASNPPPGPADKRRRQETVSDDDDDDNNNNSSTTQASQLGLIDLLNKTVEGKHLIALHERKGFDNKARIKLADIVINSEYGDNTNTVVSSHQFEQLARIICLTFEDEDPESYYVKSYTPPGGKTVLAKGKLYDRYTTLNKDLREVKLRQIRGIRMPETLIAPLLHLADSDNVLEGALKFFRENLQPWDTVVECWKKTTAYRINNLLACGNPKSNVTDYFNECKCVKQPNGFELLEIDFNQRYPDAKLQLFSNWKPFSSKVKQELLKHNVTDTSCDLDLLRQFCSLLPVCPVKVPRGKSWRPSRAEVLQGFIVHLKVIADFEKEIDNIYQCALRRGITVQPFLLVVGPSLDSVQASYVVIDQKPILVKRPPLQVFEIAFKCYFALHCEYPVQSQRQWFLIQKCLFNINLPWDVSNPYANQPEVKRLLKRLMCD